jgi:nucleoid DNA-binding protein
MKICNSHCIEKTARICKEPKKMVHDAVHHLFRFTKEQLAGKDVDSVQIPNFGKFKLKHLKSKISKVCKTSSSSMNTPD